MFSSSRLWVIKMFMGEYRHNIDAKGRLTLPSKFREKYDGSVVITKGFDGCLNIYSLSEWEVFYQKLSNIPANKKQARTMVRIITSKATECEIDKMGRINIPQSLRKQAHLEKACAIIGNINHVEIWDEATWDAYYDEQSEHLEEMSEDLDFDI